MTETPRDAIGKTPQERFEEIRGFFLEMLREHGNSRKELYYRPKPGDSRGPTEEEVVRNWAGQVSVRVNDIIIGIQRAFSHAADHGNVVTSFRFCVPHIAARLNETRGSRVGE